MNRLPVWLQLWLQKQFDGKSGKLADYVGSFLFIKQFQGWPVVRRRAGSDVLVMKAPYIGPRRVQSFSGFKPPALTGLAFAGLYFFAYEKTMGDTEALAQNVVFTGVILGAASYPFWKLARTTRFVIRFNPASPQEASQGAVGVMSWRGPDRQKQRVKLEEIYSLQVIAPHRWADEERRKHQNWMQSNPRQPGPKPLFQTASEVTLHTGPEGSHWHTIAEFTDDAHGELANRLKRAIDVVRDFVRIEQAMAQKMVVVVGPL